MTAAAFHEAGLAAMLVHLMGTSYLAGEPEVHYWNLHFWNLRRSARHVEQFR